MKDEHNPNSTLKEKDVIQIRKLLDDRKKFERKFK